MSRPSRAWSLRAGEAIRPARRECACRERVLRIQSAVFAERSGPTPASMNTLPASPSVLDLPHEGAQQRQVVAILRLDELRARRRSSSPAVARAMRAAAPTDSPRRRERRAARTLILRPLWKLCSSRSVRAISEQRDAIQVEHGLRLRVIARLHAVAGQAQHVAHAHRGAAENVALDRDAILVAAGDLHDRRVADPGQQRADGEARHVAVRAAAVGRVDRIDVAVEHAGARVDILGIGRVRRREFAS